MVLVITQETFDNAVKENIEDLGMEPEEALQEAVTQFESQGVDLSNIIKKLSLDENQLKPLKEALNNLERSMKTKEDSHKIVAQLDIIKAECEKGIEMKVAAGKAGAYNVILNILKNNRGDHAVEKACLKALIVLMNKQPDLLNDLGIDIITFYLKNDDLELKQLVLRWTRECCIMHEMNRQKIFETNIVDNVKGLLNDRYQILLGDLLGVFRALVLDDDVRVEFGKAHEHARIIATEALCPLIALLSRFKTEEIFVNDILLTISTLLVRTEFCKKVEDSGGLDLIRDILQSFISNEKMVRQCFKLLKALAGNDECKAHIIQKNLAPVITVALDKNKKNVATTVAGLACLAAITLRSPENSKAFFEGGVCPVIVDIMKVHPDDKRIQKAASWAIRNMVSRSRYQNETFIELGIEEILQNNLKKFKDIEYDTKAALRDLDCKVNFKEEWTGKGGALTSGITNLHD